MSALNRRDFIKTGGTVTAGVLFLPACTAGTKGKNKFYKSVRIFLELSYLISREMPIFNISWLYTTVI